MKRLFKLIKGLYLKNKIEKTEKKLCKYVSKFLGRDIIKVGKYIENIRSVEE
jgi:hypothetical protein